MDFEKIKSHFTVTSHWTDRRTHTHYPPSVPAGFQMMPLAISANVIRHRMRIHPHRGRSKERARGKLARTSCFTLEKSMLHRDKVCLASLSVKIMGENSKHKPTFANKILQPLFKIKHKLASLVRQQADSIPLSRASFIYIKFNTVSSSQSDNRVRIKLEKQNT